MKKLFTLLSAAIIGLTASAADWYISGQFQGWSHCDPSYKFTETSSGVYSININNKEFAGEFLIVQGTDKNPDWNSKIGGVKNMVADKEYTYVPGGDNFSVSGVINCTKIEFNTNTQKIKIYGSAGVNDYSTVYLVGDINGSGWNESLTTFPLKSTDNKTWTGSYSITNETSYFKMKAGSFIYGTGGDDVVVEMGTSYTASQSGNAFVLGKGSYTFTYVLEKNAATGTLVVTAEGTIAPTPDPTPGGKTLYVVGANNDWTPGDAAYKMTKTGDNVYTITASNIFGGEWKICDGTWDWSFGMGDSLVEGVENDCWFDGQNFSAISAGEVTLVFTLVAGSDVKDSSIPSLVKFSTDGTITPTPDPTPGDDYSDWWVNLGGPFNGNDFFEGGVQPVDGIATFENVALGNQGFKVKTWDGAKDVYYISDPLNVPVNTWVQLYEDIYDVTMTVDSATASSTYTVKFNVATNQLFVQDGSLGVEGIELEAAPVEFYNLQGVRVNNPENGFYIRVQGKNASKVYVK